MPQRQGSQPKQQASDWLCHNGLFCSTRTNQSFHKQQNTNSHSRRKARRKRIFLRCPAFWLGHKALLLCVWTRHQNTALPPQRPPDTPLLEVSLVLVPAFSPTRIGAVGMWGDAPSNQDNMAKAVLLVGEAGCLFWTPGVVVGKARLDALCWACWLLSCPEGRLRTIPQHTPAELLCLWRC